MKCIFKDDAGNQLFQVDKKTFYGVNNFGYRLDVSGTIVLLERAGYEVTKLVKKTKDNFQIYVEEPEMVS